MPEREGFVMRILVAEDDITSRILLEEFLGQWGYEVTVASNGREVMEMVDSGLTASIVLLDWMMPDVSGIDVCRYIREKQAAGQYTYIVFVTAKSDKSDIEEGFQAGADDYMTKPIDADVLHYRLEAAHRIIKYEEKLSEYAHKMETLAEQRAQKLVQSERLSTVGQLSAGIAHEINNPVTFISGNIQIMRECWPANEAALKAFLENEPGELANKARMLLQETPKMIESILSGTKRISTIVSSLNAYACQRKGTKRVVDANAIIDESLQLCRNKLKYHVEVERHFDGQEMNIVAAPQQIQQVIVNLMVNTADALNRPGIKGRLIITTDRPSDHKVRLRFRDTGPGLPEGMCHKVWDPFFTTKTSPDVTGLGLSIARGIVTEHGGTITAQNAEEGGAEFTIVLPAAPSEGDEAI